jgi:hypothetical protein
MQLHHFMCRTIYVSISGSQSCNRAPMAIPILVFVYEKYIWLWASLIRIYSCIKLES